MRMSIAGAPHSVMSVTKYSEKRSRARQNGRLGKFIFISYAAVLKQMR